MELETSDIVAPEHDILVKAVAKLDKTQHITEPTRRETANKNTEFSLTKKSNKLLIDNVVNALKETSHHVDIIKKLKKSHNLSNVLAKPLEKPQAERVKRATGYEENKTKIGRWDPVVARSRTVDFVSFPLKSLTSKLQPTNEFLSKFQLKSSLEKELDEIDPPAPEEIEEEDQKYPMSYEEMVEHRQHVAKLRAKESYKAAKAKRQSKIKSKKYHRILKKEKLKQQLQEFEQLREKNSEEALQKLESIEKARALERHTLRHKNTGKWAKNLVLRAKYDKEARQQIAEQLSISRSLTKRIEESDSSDDDISDSNDVPHPALDLWNLSQTKVHDIKTTTNNIKKSVEKVYRKDEKPVIATSTWVVESIVSEDEEEDAASDVSNAFEALEENVATKVKQKMNMLKAQIESLDKRGRSNNLEKSIAEDRSNLEYFSFPTRKTKAIIDEPLLEDSNPQTDNNITKIVSEKVKSIVNPIVQDTANLSIDSNKFIAAKPKFLTSALSNVNVDDELDDEQVVPKVNIEDVFEEEDLVDSFRQEKADEAKKDQPTDIDLSLPGWGSWGGVGTKVPKRKRNRFIVKAPPKTPRRDENKGDIIIKEYKDPKLSAHKITDVPFPFQSTAEYEASIRAPIGNMFIPEKAHKKLIKPTVITKAGTIIEPMDEDELLGPKNKHFKNVNIINLLGNK